MARRRDKPRYYIGTGSVAKFCVALFMRKYAGEISQGELDAELDRAIPLTANLFNFYKPDTLNEGCCCLVNAGHERPKGRFFTPTVEHAEGALLEQGGAGTAAPPFELNKAA